MTDTSHRKEETGGSPVTAQRGPAITDEETFELDAWGGVVRNALTTLFRKYELAEQASPHPKKPFVDGYVHLTWWPMSFDWTTPNALRSGASPKGLFDTPGLAARVFLETMEQEIRYFRAGPGGEGMGALEPGSLIYVRQMPQLSFHRGGYGVVDQELTGHGFGLSCRVTLQRVVAEEGEETK